MSELFILAEKLKQAEEIERLERATKEQERLQQRAGMFKILFERLFEDYLPMIRSAGISYHGISTGYIKFKKGSNTVSIELQLTSLAGLGNYGQIGERWDLSPENYKFGFYNSYVGGSSHRWARVSTDKTELIKFLANTFGE